MVAPQLAPPPGKADGNSAFRSVLQGAIGNVENIRHTGAQAVEKFLSGEGEELHAVPAMCRGLIVLGSVRMVRDQDLLPR